MDFTCDLNCPASGLVVSCCKHCAISKNQYKNASNKHLWSDEKGFWATGGCVLSKEEMPQECKDFDCRQHSWVVIRKWIDGWKDIEMYEVPSGHRAIGIGTVKEEK